MTRHTCGKYATVLWYGFGRYLVLCGACDRKARTTTALRREVMEARR